MSLRKSDTKKRGVLLIFDLDGTLIEGGAVPKRSPYALAKVFGITPTYDEKTTSGTVEAEKQVELGRMYGIKESEIRAHIGELFEAVTDYYRDHPGNKRALPGAKELLGELRKRGYVTALSTGNPKGVMDIKLKEAGLEDMLDIKCACETVESRTEIMKRAVKRASEFAGRRFGKDDVLCFGDTFNDIAAAEKAGFRVVALPTGKYTLEQLKEAEPDYLLSSLEDTGAVMRIIEGLERQGEAKA